MKLYSKTFGTPGIGIYHKNGIEKEFGGPAKLSEDMRFGSWQQTLKL